MVLPQKAQPGVCPRAGLLQAQHPYPPANLCHWITGHFGPGVGRRSGIAGGFIAAAVDCNLAVGRGVFLVGTAGAGPGIADLVGLPPDRRCGLLGGLSIVKAYPEK